MKEFLDYDIDFPELVYDIVDYFRAGNTIREAKSKSVVDYSVNSRFNKGLPGHTIIQPDIVLSICETLTKRRVLTCIRTGTTGMDANYIFLTKDESRFLTNKSFYVFYLNCVTYGFRYIYSAFRDKVLPVIVKKDGEVMMGTCFRFLDGIVTARHCLDADFVSIPGYSKEQLLQSKVTVSNDKDIDLAYIALGEPSGLYSDEAHVLDDVLVMGYPRIPMFLDFCAGECATISSIPSRGSIASLADQYISRKAGPLMLVTARIRGGNSGGPIINAQGAIVGVAFSEPLSEGNYDKMGYGVAYPISVLYDVLEKDNTIISVSFVDEING